MRIEFGTHITRCIKNFKSLPIIPMYNQENARYFIFGKNNNLIGAFNFDNTGVLSNVRLDEKVKRSKTAADALLSIRKFVIRKAKEYKLDFVDLDVPSYTSEGKRLKRLCEKFDVHETKSRNGILHFIGVLNPKKEFEVMSKHNKGIYG